MAVRKLMILLLLAALLLCGCDKAFDSAFTISEAKLGKEAQQILDALDNEVAFFDYSVDSTVKSFNVDIWICKDSVWDNAGSISGNIDGKTKGRIGILYESDRCKIITFDGTDRTTYTGHQGVDFSTVTSSGMMKINDSGGIVLNEEIPLLVRTGSNDNDEYRSSSMEEFRESGCEVGIAFTITFSDKILN